MRIDLPHTGAPLLNVTIYQPEGIMNQSITADCNFTLDIPNNTYLVVIEALDTASHVYGCWGYDRTQWLPYKPEYHCPQRLAPRPKPMPQVTQVVVASEQESAGENSNKTPAAKRPLE